MSLTLDLASAARPVAAAAPACALRVSVAAGFEAAEATWRRLEAEAVFTPYQRFDWQALFHGRLGGAQAPCLVMLGDETGARRALLPLAITRHGGLGIASFIGGKHANFNMGLWQRDFAAAMTAAGLRQALRQVAAESAERIDLFRLTGQPLEWDGMANPLALLPHQPAASGGHRLSLGADAEAVLARVVSPNSRRKLRKKERTLGEHGAVAFKVAETPEEARRFIDLFLVYKAARFKALGIANVFDVPGMRDFLVDGALHGLAAGRPVIELSALTVAGEPVALYGGTVANGRYSAMFNAITGGPLMRFSPGELLLHHLIGQACARGLAVFDLGVGDADYKSHICDGTDRLFDQFLPMTLAGSAAAASLRAATCAKRLVKQTPALWTLATTLRRLGR